MKLKSLLFPDLIKIMTIKDGLLKIRNYNGSIKEIKIAEIGKIYIENRNRKRYFIYGFNTIPAILSIFFTNYFEILISISVVLMLTFIVINRFVNFKSKFLVIKFKNNLVYSFQFKSNKKEQVLKIISEIKTFKKSSRK